jgi:hypothetical protein
MEAIKDQQQWLAGLTLFWIHGRPMVEIFNS